jgi:hypothetical protein
LEHLSVLCTDNKYREFFFALRHQMCVDIYVMMCRNCCQVWGHEYLLQRGFLHERIAPYHHCQPGEVSTEKVPLEILALFKNAHGDRVGDLCDCPPKDRTPVDFDIHI